MAHAVPQADVVREAAHVPKLLREGRPGGQGQLEEAQAVHGDRPRRVVGRGVAPQVAHAEGPVGVAAPLGGREKCRSKSTPSFQGRTTGRGRPECAAFRPMAQFGGGFFGQVELNGRRQEPVLQEPHPLREGRQGEHGRQLQAGQLGAGHVVALPRAVVELVEEVGVLAKRGEGGDALALGTGQRQAEPGVEKVNIGTALRRARRTPRGAADRPACRGPRRDSRASALPLRPSPPKGRGRHAPVPGPCPSPGARRRRGHRLAGPRNEADFAHDPGEGGGRPFAGRRSNRLAVRILAGRANGEGGSDVLK